MIRPIYCDGELITSVKKMAKFYGIPEWVAHWWMGAWAPEAMKGVRPEVTRQMVLGNTCSGPDVYFFTMEEFVHDVEAELHYPLPKTRDKEGKVTLKGVEWLVYEGDEGQQHEWIGTADIYTYKGETGIIVYN